MKKISLLLLMAVTLFSCTKDILYNDYVQLDRTSYTFDAKGEDVFNVTVKTNNEAAWEAKIVEGDWIQFSQEGNVLVITAAENTSTEERTAAIEVISGTATAKISLNQMPFGFSGRFVDFPLTSKGAISKNGLYAGYVDYTLKGNDFVYYAKIHNTLTGEISEVEVPVISGHGSKKDYYNGITFISNDGKTIMFHHDGHARTAVVKDGKEIELTAPEGFTNPKGMAMNGDGSVIVGNCITNDSDRMNTPVIWKNGTPQVLDMPEFIANGKPMPINGIYTRGCSEDGSVVYGSEWKLYGLIYWKNGEMMDMGSKYAEPVDDGKNGSTALIQQTSTTTNVSPNGKFIAAYYNAVGGGSMGGLFYPVVINTETGEATIYEEHIGYMGMHAANDGTIFVARQMASTGSAVIDYKTGELKSVTEWTKEKYGVSLPDTRFVTGTNEEGNVLFGMKLFPNSGGALTPGWFLRID